MLNVHSISTNEVEAVGTIFGGRRSKNRGRKCPRSWENVK